MCGRAREDGRRGRAAQACRRARERASGACTGGRAAGVRGQAASGRSGHTGSRTGAPAAGVATSAGRWRSGCTRWRRQQAAAAAPLLELHLLNAPLYMSPPMGVTTST
ncbi:hypothetical protein SEVIR_9G132150v4 [Setaria viridis]|uniref:Uncharacterized protein n=1 Tax=Setaria viridis TaxID=4556 RepID=A0A4U6T4Z7_SETVI|nr:hypothetical protein SEVIR_9G132150v2 [Setaria viridis]